MPTSLPSLAAAGLLLAANLPGPPLLPSQAPAKKPLDHSVYDGWKSIAGAQVTDDGKWAVYAINPQEGDGLLVFQNLSDGSTVNIPRGAGARFTKDGRFGIATVVPPFAEARKARRDKVKPEDQPKNSLVIVDLGTKKTTTLERVQSWQLAPKASGWILYRPEPPKAEPPKPDATKKPEAPKPEAAKSETEQKEPVKKDEPKKKADHKAGDAYVLREIATGKETKIEDVASTAWNEDGTLLAISYSSKDGKSDRVVLHDLKANVNTEVVKGLGRYSRLALPKSGDALAFTTDKDDYAAKKPTQSLYLYRVAARKLEKLDTSFLAKGWTVSENGGVSFSESGRRLLYPVAPKVEIEEDKTPDDEKVSLDVWTYLDDQLQPQQLLQARLEANRAYQAVYDLGKGTSIQLTDPKLKTASIGDRGDGKWALAVNGDPYDRESSWDPGYEDLWIIDVSIGTRKKLYTKVKTNAVLSPSGNYLAIYDAEAREWSATDLATGKKTSLSKGIPTPVFDEEDDHPDLAPPHGLGGWATGEHGVIVYDKYDAWLTDPTGATKPINLTNGRLKDTRFRLQDLDPEDRFVDAANLYFNTLNLYNKRGGFAKRADGKLSTIVEAPKRFAIAAKARNADVVLITRQDFREYPDLWATNLSLGGLKKLSDANPQIKDYKWGTAELVTWTSLDGQPLQGILYRPDDFNPAKKYPMIAYFYEKLSDDLHAHRSPAPSASTINIPLFVSNDYLVFVPDIPYKVGYPGESAISAIVPGVQSIVNRGYVNPKKIGIQGQSWGGYQVAYMITETNMFAAAEAGAPVSNMFSAYGGIRYGSGLVRQFQYEHQQSRIGGTPWNSTLRYIENSPLFHADKVQTPLMIMHNDKDGAVPYTQGIEYFTALRRLNKPVWMVVYNEEDHNLVQRKNRKDLSLRLSQFFDHFLKDAPMPEWMAKGVPATEKGRNLGLKLSTGG